MNKPHKHAELIKAWADGAEIEFWHKEDGEWKYSPSPLWNASTEYRIKPELKKLFFYLYTCEGIYEVIKDAPVDGYAPYNDKWKHVKTFEYTEGEE